MKVAIIGTVGVPACYGGYETLVENLLTHRQRTELTYQVYCSSVAYSEHISEYKGAKLVYIPFKANGWQSIIYDSVSLIHAYFTCDCILSLGVGGVVLPLMKLFSGKPVYVNLDGQDHKRDKFGAVARAVIGTARWIAAKFATLCIADNEAICDDAIKEYGRDSVLIEYGGDNARTVDDPAKLAADYGLLPRGYSITVARIEPENNIRMILQAYSQLKDEILVVVGNWNNSEFGRSLRAEYCTFENIRMLDPIYEADSINLLRSNCKLYLHGHSAGGTNPSLVEAMSLGLPIIAYDVVYNRYTTENKAIYFDSEESIRQIVKSLDNERLSLLADSMESIAQRRYTWEIICRKYEDLF